MSTRAVRLAASGASLTGFILFAIGLVLALTGSWSTGRDLGSTGAILMGATRLAARRWKLPAP